MIHWVSRMILGDSSGTCWNAGSVWPSQTGETDYMGSVLGTNIELSHGLCFIVG